ncbi:MAG: cytochrome c maturation protein CcmE [Chloroflexi bacterium]|nr:cytochrome c maturation protein CcmE [Chloroflexota bacterium]
MRKGRRWLTAIVVILALGLGYLGYSLFIHSAADELTVSKLRAQASSLNGQQVTVGGRVAPGSIDWDRTSGVIRFRLTDGKENLTVAYKGIVPDSFKPGAELVMAGKYDSDGIFEAQSFGRRRSLCNICH